MTRLMPAGIRAGSISLENPQWGQVRFIKPVFG